LGDVRQLNIDDVDSIIRDFHAEVTTPALRPTEPTGDVPEAKRQKSDR
jgi:homocitrate synthase